MDNIEEKAKAALRAIGVGMTFRDGQLEAIKSVLTDKRTLVVQRTGWGKSLVYFICTKLLRDEGAGITVVISPLQVLMANQKDFVDSHEELGLKCAVLHSDVKESREKSYEYIKQTLDEIARSENENEKGSDIIFTTPETLFSKIEPVLEEKNIKIGMFVIDEAHCISDWGHDFRLDYCRLNRVIKSMPSTVPILATTATASQRVVDDLQEQLGGDEVKVLRGPLMRDNLFIQTLNLDGRSERYAWILDYVPRLREKVMEENNSDKASGIIYCLTKNDCDDLAKFLQQNDINARSYHAGDEKKKECKEIEGLFMDNDLDVIVSTTKLGMGYDKPDVAFVIHFQTPGSIVAYYQQIGRAGRDTSKVKHAYTFLMSGREDDDIHESFRKTAFPTEAEATSVYGLVADNFKKEEENVYVMTSFQSLAGMMQDEVNMPTGRIQKTLEFLDNEGFIYKKELENYVSKNSRSKEKETFYEVLPTAKAFEYNGEHYKKITKQREDDYEQIKALMDTDKCYNREVIDALDDNTEGICEFCANCKKDLAFSTKVSESSRKAANDYLEKMEFPIPPRSRWAGSNDATDLLADRLKKDMPEKAKLLLEMVERPKSEPRLTLPYLKPPKDNKQKVSYMCGQGVCLSRLFRPKYGELVWKWVNGKKELCDDLVKQSAEVLTSFIDEYGIKTLTYVPSQGRGELMKEFSEKLAKKLNIDCVVLLKKKDGAQKQKKMNNSFHQCLNALESLDIADGAAPDGNILLVDDMVDSRWTLTVCGFLLKKAGAENVYPFALASSSQSGDGDD